MVKSYISSVLILLLFVVVETAILSNISFLPASPDFLMMCVLYFSMRNGKIAGETTGFVSGLFLDFLSGSPFGMNALIRTLLGYLGGILHKLVNYESFFISMILGFAATLIKAGLIYLISCLFPRYVNSYHLFSSVFALELVLNTIFTPLIFRLMRVFDAFIVPSDRRDS